MQLLSTSNDSQSGLTDGLPAVMTPEETGRFLRLGRTKTYELLRMGVIPSVKTGKQFRILRDRLLAWLNGGGLDTQDGRAR
jgi:excisionase family DNA binding protein